MQEFYDPEWVRNNLRPYAPASFDAIIKYKLKARKQIDKLAKDAEDGKSR
jgi:hypothetical protein